MASTNQTTHYELSQYIGTDKPTYLVDYNGDMAKIDSGIYGAKSEADTNATSIGTLSSLGTSEKTNLVGAINEVNTQTSANTTNIGTNTGNITTLSNNIGNLTNLNTTIKTNLVSAINEVNAKNDDLTNILSLNTSNINITGGVLNNVYNGAVAWSNNSKWFKCFAYMNVTSNANTTTINIPLPAGLNINDTYTINCAGLIFDSVSSTFVGLIGLNVSSNGFSFELLGINGKSVLIMMLPFLYNNIVIEN